MSINIRPDPKRPNGGYAELSLDAAQLGQGETGVTVFDPFSERYLGDGGWQSEKATFGPYPVTHDSAGKARLVIGPEVVNEIEEYATVRLTIGPVTDDLAWPDDVFPLPGAAQIGSLYVSRSEAPQAPSNLVQDQVIEPEPEPEEVTGPEPESEPEPQKSNKMLFILLALCGLIAAAAAAWYFSQSGEPAPEPETVVKDEPAPQPTADPCSADAFSNVAGASFAERQNLLLQCTGSASQDTAFLIVEDGAAANDPDALAILGQLYDPDVNDSAIETEFGLSLGDSLPRAAEYYARAQAAGNDAIAARLGEICATLAAATDTPSQNAVEEFCSR